MLLVVISSTDTLAFMHAKHTSFGSCGFRNVSRISHQIMEDNNTPEACPVRYTGALLLDLCRGLLYIATYEPLMGKPTLCKCENKGADQLRSNCEADQRICFRYSDSTLPLLLKSEISSF